MPRTDFMACVPNFVVAYIIPFKSIVTMATVRLEKAGETSILFQVRQSILRAHRLVVSNLDLETKGSRSTKAFVKRLEVEVRR